MDKYSFVVPQKAVIKQGDKYLILKRSPKAPVYPNHWDFPGGRLEHGEDATSGLEREVFEETGLKINVIRLVQTLNENPVKRNHFYIAFECRILSGEVRLSHEHTAFRWATKEEILKLNIENIVRKCLENE
jgi:ADP-ribose pyrophosphatase YjhB (NUDIX family)